MLVVCISLASGEAAWGQSTTRVSVPDSGPQGNSISAQPAISADGRFVAFSSSATNLVAGDTNALDDIFVRDRTDGTTTRVSVPASGAQALGGHSSRPAISADGRFVAFHSFATNLVAGDSNGRGDVFVRDRNSGTTTRVSLTSTGAQANGSSVAAAISADGRFVAFQSSATNLVAGDSNSAGDIFVRDRTGGTTTRVSLTSTGTQSSGHSTNAVISDDGRFVAFVSRADDLVAGDSNFIPDLFLRDRTGGTTTRVSVTSTGTQATGGGGVSTASPPAMSGGAGLIAWSSDATNLVAGDDNGRDDVFVRDRAAATTTRASVPNSGFQASGNSSGIPAISSDGRIVAFRSTATDLVAGDTNGQTDIFVRDRNAATTSRVSLTSTGTQANGGGSLSPVISADGRFVAFQSGATNLVAGDSNAVSDIFVRDRGAFGRRTRVTLSLARKRIPARGPLRVRVRNRNRFAVYVRLSGRTVRRVSRGGRKRRVRLRTRSFNVNGRARRTVRLRLPRAVRRLLRRRGKVSLRLTARVTGPAGKTRTVKKRVTPRLRKKRRR
jgi:Tol biopolymer transport system component